MRPLFLLLLAIFGVSAPAQLPPGGSPPAHGELPAIAPGLARIEGVDAGSGIAYTRIFLSAKASGPLPAEAPAVIDLGQPTMTAQCTKDASGKYAFDIYVNFGSMADPAFYPPWKPTKEHPNAAKTRYVNLNLTFKGYMSQSFKREFSDDWRPATQYRYNPPGNHSANLEPSSSFAARLRAMPLLTVNDNKQLAQFETTPLLDRVHSEPLCKASGL